MKTTSILFLFCLAIIVVVTTGCGTNRTTAESDFLKRCPEVPLAKIPQDLRTIFMAAYEGGRPRLEGKDIVMLATQQEITEFEKTYKVKILGRKDVWA